jgi:hypothetical protein
MVRAPADDGNQGRCACRGARLVDTQFGRDRASLCIYPASRGCSQTYVLAEGNRQGPPGQGDAGSCTQ